MFSSSLSFAPAPLTRTPADLRSAIRACSLRSPATVKTAAVLAPARRLARPCSLCARAAACIRALYHRVSPQFLNNPKTILKISKFSFYSTSFSTGNPVPNLLPAVEAYSRPFLPTCNPLPAAKASSQALPLSFQLSPSRQSVFQALSPDLQPSPSCQSIISGPSSQLPTFSQPSKRIPGPSSRLATLSQLSKHHLRPFPSASKFLPAVEA